MLQERKVRPVGGNHELDVDVRVVAATNVDVEKAVQEGSFRQDLFYRLNVIRIRLPPLRERVEDIPLLAAHFLQKHSALEGKRLSFSQEAMQWIMQQAYPGNVRELENVVERAVALATEPYVVRRDVQGSSHFAPVTTEPQLLRELPPEGVDLDAVLGELEKSLLLQALERTGGNRTSAAKLLRTTFRSLRYRLAKYGLGEDPSTAPGDENGDNG